MTFLTESAVCDGNDMLCVQLSLRHFSKGDLALTYDNSC